MPEVGSASLAIIPSFKGFQSNLESGTGKAMTAAGISGGTQFGDSAGKAAGSKFRSHVKNFAKIAAVGVGIATAAAFKFAGDSVAEAREAQKVGALTESTIKATGKAARVTAKHVGDLSGKISKKVGIDDEAIQSGANMLLTFKNIRNEAGEGNKIFDESLTTLVDFSSAMGTDAKSSAVQLGKALNDPIKGITALGRAGVQFSEDQKDAIKKMVESGDTLGAQKVILRELKGEFGGAAKAQATEADKLSVAWGNFKEEIGTELLPVMDDLSKFLRKKGIPALEKLGDWVRDTGIPKFKEFAGHVKDIGEFLNDLPRDIKIGGLGALVGLVGVSKLRHGTGPLGAAGRAAGLAAPVRTFETNPAALGGGLGGAAPKSKLGKAASAASKAVLPVAIVAWSGLALKDFYTWNHSKDKGPLSALSGGRVGEKARNLLDPHGADDFKAAELEKAAAAYRGINDATKKLPNQLDQGKTAAENLYGEIFKIGKADPKVNYTAPGFDELLRKTREYDSLLDGLNNRIITTIMQTRYVKNDTGEGGGTNPQPPGRSGGVDVHIHGDVRPNDSREFMTYLQNRTRAGSLDGMP